MTNDETRLWASGEIECVMVSCCAGAELQVRERSIVILRELYPMKSDLYERSRALEAEVKSGSGAIFQKKPHSGNF